MTIQDLIALATKRLSHLTQLRAAAEMLGDVNAMSVCDTDITETEATLSKLKAL